MLATHKEDNCWWDYIQHGDNIKKCHINDDVVLPQLPQTLKQPQPLAIQCSALQQHRTNSTMLAKIYPQQLAQLVLTTTSTNTQSYKGKPQL
jgi:hypothetical protein